MQLQTAVVIGATGLIGSHVVEELLNDETFNKVRVLVRKPYLITHPKLEIKMADFNNVNDYGPKMEDGDCIFCCIGTTQQKMSGNKEAYRKVDYDIAVNAARAGWIQGFKKYLLVSSIGANAGSSNFYLNLKGEIERDLASISFQSIHIFRPSMLLGKRNEFRFGELAGKGLMKPLSFLLVGPLRKFKPIQALDVAKAMVAAAKKNMTGTHIYTYDEIKNIADSKI
jgi:uncharacterized protein YbjT (DUF2867 family)